MEYVRHAAEVTRIIDDGVRALLQGATVEEAIASFTKDGWVVKPAV